MVGLCLLRWISGNFLSSATQHRILHTLSNLRISIGFQISIPMSEALMVMGSTPVSLPLSPPHFVCWNSAANLQNLGTIGLTWTWPSSQRWSEALRQKGTLWVGQDWGGMEKVILDPRAMAGVWTGRADQRPWKEFVQHLGTLKIQICSRHPLHMSGAEGGSLGLMMRKKQVCLWMEVIVGVIHD